MKIMNTILCGLGLLIAPTLQAQDDWTLKSPATKPSARSDHAMASLGDDQVLLFGGFDAFFLFDETWVYDLSDNTWTLKSPATKPSARFGHAMASLGGDQVLLFGGQVAGGFDDETWVYDLSDNTWTLKSPATKPSARFGHAMASLGGDQVLLFGGFDGANDDETWVYDLSDNTWTLKSPATKPSARNDHAMASLGGDQVLLFGGLEAGGLDDETWVYDLSDNTWTLKSPATKPSARQAPAMASLGGDQVLLFGGGEAGGRDDETWVYDLSDNTWTLKSPATKPSARDAHAMASLGGAQVLLFGGQVGGGFAPDETWVYPATPPVKPFVFVAEKDVTIDRLGNSEGNIHANNDIVFKKGNSTTYKGDLTAVDDISIGTKNKITGNLTAGDDIDVASGAKVSGTQAEHAAVATEPLPSPAFSAGSINVSVPASGTRTLAPGFYNSVTVNKKGTLKLSSGDYFVDKLALKESAKLIIDVGAGPVKINVVEKLSFDAKVVVSITPTGEVGSNQVTFTQLDDEAVSIGQSAKVLGTIIAVEAEVRLSKSSRFKGAVCAENIVVEPGAIFLPHGATTSLPKTAEFEAPEVAVANVITDYVLEQNYPNPFNPSTTISFALREAGDVKLSVYDLTGQLVKTLVAGNLPAGRHNVIWNATNENGGKVASGVYFYKLVTNSFVSHKKLVLMK